jgi:hypothetical protein
MTPAAFLQSVIAPRERLLSQYVSAEASCLLLAIAGQESDWTQRLPPEVETDGPRGFWRCTKHGLTLRTLTAEATRGDLHRVCLGLSIPLGLDAVHEAVAWNDTLAYCVARLALVLDQSRLPAIGDPAAARETYLRVWVPAEPRPERWAERYEAAAALFAPAAEAAAVAPGFWMNEITGALRPAVEAYLRGEELTEAGFDILRSYLRQWIAAPVYAGAAIEELRASVDGLTTRRALDEWVALAEEAGVDPF